MMTHRTQTHESGLCATLLPRLAPLPQPLATDPGPYLRGTVFPNPDIVQMHLTVANYAQPEQTPRSPQAPGREILTINGQVTDLIHQSNGVDTVRWQIARGVQAQLTGQADVVGAGIVALTQRVRPLTTEDPGSVRGPMLFRLVCKPAPR
jgi:hypothetical protein